MAKRNLFLSASLLVAALSSCDSTPAEKDPCTYYVFEDPTRSLSAPKALEKFHGGAFTESTDQSINPGFTKSYFWIAVDKPDTSAPLMLQIGTPHVNTVEFFTVADSRTVSSTATGDHFPYSERPLPTLNFVFPLEERAAVYLIKVDKSFEALQCTFRSFPRERFYSHAIQDHLVMGLLTGLLLLMCIFAAFLFAIARERVYLFYLLYMVVAWAYVLANLGYGYKYLWPESPWMAERARPILALLAVSLTLFFLEAYIGRPVARWLHLVLRSVAAVSLLLVILVILGYGIKPNTTVGYYFQFAVPVLSFVFVAGLFTTLIQKMASKNRMALFYFCSLIPLIAFTGLQIFYYSGGIDFSFSYLQNYGQATGYVAQAIILTFGLAYRFNSYRVERERLLVETNRQQAIYAKAIISTQESERRQLADQLHDVAGSLLSSAKLNLSSIREKNFLADEEARRKLVHAEGAVTEIADMLRNLSHAISPVMMDKVGFRQSVEKIVNIFNSTGKIKVELEMLGFEEMLPQWQERFSVLYGILYELMNNIVKHAKAQHALVQLIEHEDSFVMVVEDDGVGLEPEKLTDSSTHGLAAIRSKIHYFNGAVVFDRAVPQGLIVAIEIPKEEDDENYSG